MVHQGDVGQVKAHFGPFGYRIKEQDRCSVCAERTMLGNHFGRPRWYS
jgi:hypothetical protein